MENLEQPLELTIEWTFCPYLFLEILCVPKKTLDIFKQYSGQRDATEFPPECLKGYELALLACLHLFLDNVVKGLSVIGLPDDYEFYRFYSENAQIINLQKRLPPHNPASAIIAYIAGLSKGIRGSGNWGDLELKMRLVHSFAETIGRIFTSCYVGEIKENNERQQFVDPQDVLHELAPRTLLIFLNDYKKLRIAYSDMYRHDRRILLLPEIPNDWLKGYLYANFTLWKFLLPEGNFRGNSHLFEKILHCQTWEDFDRCFEPINEIILEFERESLHRLSLKKVKEVPAYLRSKFMSPSESLPEAFELESIFTHPITLVEGEDPISGPTLFSILLKGIVWYSRATGDKVKVIKFVHPVTMGKNSYSFAILMPAFSNIADHSSWWVFFDFCTDFSGTGGQAYAAVLQSLEAHKDDVELETHEVDVKKLATFCESPEICFLRSELKKVRKLDSDIRGTFPELLIMAYLGAVGCFPIKTRFKPQILGGKELDVVGFLEKSKLMYLFETKGKARISEDWIEDKDLSKDILDFWGKVKLVQKNRPGFAKELGINKSDFEIKAIFVTLADIKRNQIEWPSDIEMWDFGQFRERLRSAQVSKHYIKLLEQQHLARTLVLNSDFVDGVLGDEGNI